MDIVKLTALIGCVFFLLTTLGLSVGIAVAVTFPRSETKADSVFFETASTEWAENCTVNEWTLFSKTNTLGANMQYVVINDAQGSFIEMRNASYYAENLHTVYACTYVCWH